MDSQDPASDINRDDVIKYIDQTLMEEDAEEKVLSYQGSLALQAVEISFLEALNHSDQTACNTNFDGPLPRSVVLPFCQLDSGFPFSSSVSSGHTSHTFLLSRIESMVQFKNGVEEARKFLPVAESLPVVCLESNKLSETQNDDHNNPKEKAVGEIDKSKMELAISGLEGRKKYYRDCQEDEDISELFDKLFLSPQEKEMPLDGVGNKDLSLTVNTTTQPQQNTCNMGKRRAKKRRSKNHKVDLRSLLWGCARAIVADQKECASALLKQIRQHCSPIGNGPQRLAHYFADGLEARLTGTGFVLYSAIAAQLPSPAQILQGYKSFLSDCPYSAISYIFATYHILKSAEKAKTLHIIDFGIIYGFQWPMVIQHLSARPGGPPKLRITGLEYPHPYLQARNNIERVRDHVSRYCARFGVPLEYKAIEKEWDAIQIEELNIRKGEVTVVNCINRLGKLLHEALDIDQSPRITVLKLIREINPDIFVHGIINASHSFPAFLTRFQEAFNHYSSIIDMLDTIIDRENQERLRYERHVIGSETMNVIACEGTERIFRPMRYKSWEALAVSTGFQLAELNEELMESLRGKMQGCHKNFGLHEDGEWVLLTWKGRTLRALSCWTPA